MISSLQCSFHCCYLRGAQAVPVLLFQTQHLTAEICNFIQPCPMKFLPIPGISQLHCLPVILNIVKPGTSRIFPGSFVKNNERVIPCLLLLPLKRYSCNSSNRLPLPRRPGNISIVPVHSMKTEESEQNLPAARDEAITFIF